MAEGGKRLVRAMKLTPVCQCKKRIVYLDVKEDLEVDEDGVVYIYGFCEDRCRKITVTLEVLDAISELKKTPFSEAEAEEDDVDDTRVM